MVGNESNGLAATARAFATYSLVPYLGILFCPGAVLVGTVGVFRSYGSRHTSPQTSAARTACYVSTAIGIVVLIAQLLLWWILYQVPVWAQTP